jgi:phosphoribosylanthranilate isomerase
MSLKIKICGLRDHRNILEITQLKPDLMGFIFFPGSLRYADMNLSSLITSSLPKYIRKTGVFVNSDYDAITAFVRKYSLDIVQLHGDESPDICRRLKDTGIHVIKTFNISRAEGFDNCSEYIPYTNYFLFDTLTPGHGGSGIKFDWSILDNYNLKHPFFLSGGISPGDASEIPKIDNPSFYGIDINSRFETEPGLKDIESLKKFIAEIRSNKTSL